MLIEHINKHIDMYYSNENIRKHFENKKESKYVKGEELALLRRNNYAF